MENQKLVILVINYGTDDYLKELLTNFMLSLPRFPQMRIDWVVTDCSKNRDFLGENWEEQMKGTFRNKKNNFFHFFSASNRGFAGNVNFSYHLFRQKLGDKYHLNPSDFILLLNPDTLIFWSNIEKALKFMNFTPDAMVAGMALTSPKGEREKWCHSLTFPSLESWKLLWGGKRFSEPVSSNIPTSVAWVSGGSMLVRGSWWEQMKGFDRGYFFYFEDVDFCKRTGLAGGKVYFLPNITISHRRGASDISIYKRKRYFYASEARYFYLYRSSSEYIKLRIVRVPFKIYYFFRCYFAPSFWLLKIQKIKKAFLYQKKEGYPVINEFKRIFWSSKNLKEIWLLSFLINILVLGLAIWGRSKLPSPMIMHYNAYLGIDAYGDSSQLLIFPALAFLVFLFNLVLEIVFTFSRRYTSFILLPASASLAFQITLAIAMINLILFNRI